MLSSTDNLDLELSDVQHLAKRIQEAYGFDFSNYAISSFKRRVMMVLRKNGFKSLEQLEKRILADKDFFEAVLLDITVNTTEMFRDPSFWALMRQQVLPLYAEREEIAIWHAACSSGEEVLSMAITLKEQGLLSRAKLYATDINHLVLARAASGRYPQRNEDLFAKNYRESGATSSLENYYEIIDNELRFDTSLLGGVKFKQHDLVQDHHFYKFDIILCRNVMIYFNQELQNHVFEMLHESLFMGGSLCLGAKESMVWCRIQDKFETLSEREKVYKKVKL